MFCYVSFSKLNMGCIPTFLGHPFSSIIYRKKHYDKVRKQRILNIKCEDNKNSTNKMIIFINTNEDDDKYENIT